MRAMSRVERFFERLVERPSKRLFRTRLQPVQVLRRIERAMEAERGAGGRANLVPDAFIVHVHPDDLAALAPEERFSSDLASAALSFARSHGYALRERPRVSLRPDPKLEPGEIEVQAAVSAEAARPPDPGIADGGTRVFEVPVVRAPRVRLLVSEPGSPSRPATVEGGPLVIGRAPDSGLVLRDSQVSRHHAQLRARDGVLVLTDLDSTNGTLVNGRRVREVVLGGGDRIQVGQTTLVVEAIGDDRAGGERMAAPSRLDRD